MPATQLTQKQLSVVSRFTNVVQHRSATRFAGIVDNQIAKAEDSLRDTRRHSHVLDFAERDIPGRTGY